MLARNAWSGVFWAVRQVRGAAVTSRPRRVERCMGVSVPEVVDRINRQADEATHQRPIDADELQVTSDRELEAAGGRPGVPAAAGPGGGGSRLPPGLIDPPPPPRPRHAL